MWKIIILLKQTHIMVDKLIEIYLFRWRDQFLNFLGARFVYCIKGVFFTVNGSLRWLNNVTGVYLVQVSLLLMDKLGVLGRFFRYRPLLPIGWRIVQILPQRRRKMTNANHKQYKQLANPLLSRHHFSPLVISRNDKNKQPTLLSQNKLSSTRELHFCVINSLE